MSPTLALSLLVIALIVTGILSIGIGAKDIPPGEVVSILWNKISGQGGNPTGVEGVIWQIRIPRVLLAILVGSALSVAGGLMQGLFRNPLAEPALIGVSSGAALGAVFVIVLGGILFPNAQWVSDLRFLPIAAFAGALAVTFFIQRLTTTSGYTAVATLLLAGVAVNALVGAVIGLCTFLASDAQLRSLTFWTLGSLGAASWTTVAFAAPFCLGLVLVAPFFAQALNAMALGEAEASHLGFSVEKVKTFLIIISAAGVGACVAFTGIIGFVGLVIPHLIRLWIGPNHRYLLPGSALLGALLLTAADTAARTIAAPAELPIGILTAAVGGPFFLFMLLRQRKRALWG